MISAVLFPLVCSALFFFVCLLYLSKSVEVVPLVVVFGPGVLLALLFGGLYRVGLRKERDRNPTALRSPRRTVFGAVLLLTGLASAGLSYLIIQDEMRDGAPDRVAALRADVDRYRAKVQSLEQSNRDDPSRRFGFELAESQRALDERERSLAWALSLSTKYWVAMSATALFLLACAVVAWRSVFWKAPAAEGKGAAA